MCHDWDEVARHFCHSENEGIESSTPQTRDFIKSEFYSDENAAASGGVRDKNRMLLLTYTGRVGSAYVTGAGYHNTNVLLPVSVNVV